MASARLFVVGDDVDTDQLAPGAYMRGGIDALAAHCLETLRPGFAAEVRPGDVLVAGRNFGTGSSREQAAEALVHLGVAAVVARSFGGIFYRNAINLGLPVVTAAALDAAALGIEDGTRARLELDASRLTLADGRRVAFDPVPGNLRELLADGGLVPHLKRRLAARGAP